MRSNHQTKALIGFKVPYYVVYNCYHKCPWLHYTCSCFILHAQRQGLKRNLLFTAYSLCVVFGVYLHKKRWLLGLRPRPLWRDFQCSRPPFIPLAGWEGCPPSHTFPMEAGEPPLLAAALYIPFLRHWCMCVYMCMCVCVCVCVCACVYVYMCVHVCVCVNVAIYP